MIDVQKQGDLYHLSWVVRGEALLTQTCSKEQVLELVANLVKTLDAPLLEVLEHLPTSPDQVLYDLEKNQFVLE